MRGSKRRRRLKDRLACLKRREANARSAYLHQQSASLARRYGTIVIEQLAIKNMMRSARGTVEEPGTMVAKKSALNRSISDAAWGRLITFLVYKAERAGGRVIRVNPKNTSNLCSRCGHLTPSKIGDDFSWAACGHSLDRDHNAVRNILARGIVVPVAEAALLPSRKMPFDQSNRHTT